MKNIIVYGIIFMVLLVLELLYFRIADKFNIIDKPNERSSHSTIVLRGGGIIFAISAIVWAIAAVSSFRFQVSGFSGCYPWFIIGLVLIAGVSFVDDIRSLPDSVRLVAQFVAMMMMFYQLGLFDEFQVSGSAFQGIVIPLMILLVALFVCVGATNVINFMDGINGITGAYALAVLLPLMAINCGFKFQVSEFKDVYFDQSLLVVTILAVLVFCIFNFRPKGKAKCFAGDVGSIGIAFIMLFLIGKVIISTGDVTYLIFLLVYGVDGVLTICHRIMLHENLGEAHRKHAFQLMANELKIGHVKVSLLYMVMQLVVSLGFIGMTWMLNDNDYDNDDIVLAHWIYMIVAIVVLAVAYILFKKKYYHLHEEYLASLARN